MTTCTITLRPATADDREFLCRVYESTRLEELAAAPWTPEEVRTFLRMQFEAQDRYYREHYQGAAFDVIELDGVPAGRLYVARWPAEIRVIDIALLPEHRGGGVATALFERLFAEADASRCSVSIHVEQHNPARRLYERLGFLPEEDRGVYLFMVRPAR